MRRRVSLLLTALLGVGCSKPTEPPTVVVVVLDALHADHVSHLGYPRETTPNLDRLAADGVTFTQAVAPAPYTLATMASLHTGLLPDAHGITQGGRRLPEERATLAAHLSDHGWRCFGASGNLNASSLQGLHRGFERFLEMHRPAGARDRAGAKGDAPETETDLRAAGLRPPLAEEFPPVLADWLDELAGDEKALLYLHLLEPHSPYRAPDEVRARFVADDYDGPFADGETRPFLRSIRGELDVSDADVAAGIGLYDANLAYADAALGELLRQLRDDGRYDDALIVVTSDHGEAFWQHGRWGHNDELYEEMVHVPLVVKLPAGRGAPGSRVDALVSPMDLLPSLCEWTGVPTPTGLHGVPLQRAIEAAPAARSRKLVLRNHDEVPRLALRADGVKVVRRDGHVDLYDLDADPDERAPRPIDSSPQGPALLDFLDRFERVRAGWEGAAVEGAALTTEQERLLEELGYLK